MYTAGPSGFTVPAALWGRKPAFSSAIGCGKLLGDGSVWILVRPLRIIEQQLPGSVSIEQFRPTLWPGAYIRDEDSWKVIRTPGSVSSSHHPSRSASKHPAVADWKTLIGSPRIDNGDVDFWPETIARNSGVIRVGDEVSGCFLPAARRKPTGQVKATIPRLPSAQQQATVAIEWQGQQFTGTPAESC